jgi:uncharacterized membrane protein
MQLSRRAILIGLGIILFYFTVVTFLNAFPPDGFEDVLVCEFVPMGDFPGGYQDFFSAASDVSSDGMKVTGHGTAADASLPATVGQYRVAAGWTDPSGSVGFCPGLPPGLVSFGFGSTPGDTMVESFASAISGDGAVAVGKVMQGNIERPVRWIDCLPPQLLGTVEGDTSGFATDASGDGKVMVGFTSPAADFKSELVVRHATRWRFWSGSFNPLALPDSVPGFAPYSSYATGVSESGETIVGALFDTNNGGRGKSIWPALWWRATSATDFSLLVLSGENGNSVTGVVDAITPDGRVAVGSIGVWPAQKACWWGVALPLLPPIKANLIPFLPGDTISFANSTDFGGTRIFGAHVEGAGKVDSLWVVKSFVYDPGTNTIRDLREFMDATAGTPPPPGWDIGQIAGASDNAMTLVGAGGNGSAAEGWIYRCHIVHRPWWRRFIELKRHPGTKAPPPIDPLGDPLRKTR